MCRARGAADVSRHGHVDHVTPATCAALPAHRPRTASPGARACARPRGADVQLLRQVRAVPRRPRALRGAPARAPRALDRALLLEHLPRSSAHAVEPRFPGPLAGHYHLADRSPDNVSLTVGVGEPAGPTHLPSRCFRPRTGAADRRRAGPTEARAQGRLRRGGGHAGQGAGPGAARAGTRARAWFEGGRGRRYCSTRVHAR